MIEHFACEAALVVEYERCTSQIRERPADEDALVQMGVDDVNVQVKSSSQNCSRQEWVENQLAPVRSDQRVSVWRQGRDTTHSSSGRRGSGCVGENCDMVTGRFESPSLLKDSHMTSIVGKEACWGDLDNSLAHDVHAAFRGDLCRARPVEESMILEVCEWGGKAGDRSAER